MGIITYFKPCVYKPESMPLLLQASGGQNGRQVIIQENKWEAQYQCDNFRQTAQKWMIENTANDFHKKHISEKS